MFDIVPVVLVLNDEFWLPYALSSVQGLDRYVIYDVGSKDGTGNIIDWFIETESKKGADFFVRSFDEVPSISMQGIFRNSMIAEAQSDWVIILDGDEAYKPTNWWAMKETCDHTRKYSSDKIYGVFNRTEIGSDLRSCYDEFRTHHRIYHRTAIWKGTHPGEEPVLQQKPYREFPLPVMCYHFHNAQRSRLEEDVPGRTRRKHKGTYQPGNLQPFDLLEYLPMLRKPIENFPVPPELERLQHEFTK